MLVEIEAYKNIKQYLDDQSVTLVAVSKTKPNNAIEELYDLGQKDFGENYVQELVDKEIALPKDIRWHFIGHLQSNKVKYIAPFVHLIHGVDSLKLLQEINKQAIKNNRIIHCLLQVHIAKEETKFGMNEIELQEAIIGAGILKNIKIVGFMGMASFSDNKSLVQNEFKNLQALFMKYQQDKYPQVQLSILSMGMSGDYQMAIENGSTMVRIGSLLFGARNYVK
jgi:PLP dependent protein